MTVNNKTAIGTLGSIFTVTNGVVGIVAATTSVPGTMSAADKTKLDGITNGGLKVSSNDTTPGYLNGKLIAGAGVTLTENNNASNETLSIGISGTADHWISIPSGYTATPASTSTLTMTSDLTSSIKVGYGLRYTIGGVMYCGIVSAITSNLLTIAGAPLSGDVSNLYYTKTGVVNIQILIPGYYEDATDNALLANDLGHAIIWQMGPACLVRAGFKTRVADSSSDGKARAYVNGNVVTTANSSAGLTLAGTGWYYTVVDISTTYYEIAFGNAVEIGSTKGTGGTAQDLSVVLTFVVL